MVPGKRVDVRATKSDGSVVTFQAKSRIDSAIEVDYYQHGGILQYVLREVMVKGADVT
jgi:aconitate hydratase